MSVPGVTLIASSGMEASLVISISSASGEESLAQPEKDIIVAVKIIADSSSFILLMASPYIFTNHNYIFIIPGLLQSLSNNLGDILHSGFISILVLEPVIKHGHAVRTGNADSVRIC